MKKQMGERIIATLIVAFITVLASLTPQHQHFNDLNVIVSFAKQHEYLMSDLRDIDMLERQSLMAQRALHAPS